MIFDDVEKLNLLTPDHFDAIYSPAYECSIHKTNIICSSPYGATIESCNQSNIFLLPIYGKEWKSKQDFNDAFVDCLMKAMFLYGKIISVPYSFTKFSLYNMMQLVSKITNIYELSLLNFNFKFILAPIGYDNLDVKVFNTSKVTKPIYIFSTDQEHLGVLAVKILLKINGSLESYETGVGIICPENIIGIEFNE